MRIVRTVAEVREALRRAAVARRADRPGADDGRLPCRAHRPDARGSGGLRPRGRQPLRQPVAVQRRRRPRPLPARRGRGRAGRRGGGRRSPVRAGRGPSSIRRASTRGSSRASWDRCSRARSGRDTSAASRRSARSCSRSSVLRPPGSGRRTPSRSPSSGRSSRTWTCRSRFGCSRPCATPTAWRSRHGTSSSRMRNGRSRSRCRGRSRPGRRRMRVAAIRLPRRVRVLDSERGLTVDYVAVADFDVPTLVAAVRVGGTRLIDNVPLVDNRPITTDAARHG